MRKPGRPRRWTVDAAHGIWEVRLASWKYFYDYVRAEMLEFNHYVWRGDRCDNRTLLPSFDRQHARRSQAYIEIRSHGHLASFQRAVCGRRGVNPAQIQTENDWWALGQHYGLATPLLDWTNSPFVALFFAFEKLRQQQTPCRAVYAISPGTCEALTPDIKKAHDGQRRPDIVEFFTPLQDESSRLVNQNGLFSRCTAGKSLDQWVSEKFPKEKGGILLKILIPDEGREECLRTLNKMNINHLTLFPDLYGASNFCNMADSITKY